MIAAQITKQIQQRGAKVKQQLSKVRQQRSGVMQAHQSSAKGFPSVAADGISLQRGRDIDLHDEVLLESERADITLANISAAIPHQRWANLVGAKMKRNNWSRLGDLAKVLSTVPEDVAAMFDWHEKAKGLTFDDETRLKFYKDFTRSALGASVLQFEEVEALFLRLGLADHLSRSALRTLISSKIDHGSDEGGGGAGGLDGGGELCDVEMFIALTCELRRRFLDTEARFGPAARLLKF